MKIKFITLHTFFGTTKTTQEKLRGKALGSAFLYHFPRSRFQDFSSRSMVRESEKEKMEIFKGEGC